MEAIGWRALPALAVTSLAMAAALPARVHAAPTYTKEMVGNICKSTADSLVTMGQATSYFADRYIGEGQKSFTDDTFTFCKVILKFKGPKIVFNPNWQAELAADERQRTTAIQTILAGRCANFGASLHNETFEARSGSARPASFCENNGTVYFMYTDYTVDGASLHRLNIAEPKTLGGNGGADYYAFLADYGYMTAEAKAAAQVEAQRAAAADHARHQEEDRKRIARLNAERPIKRQIGTRVCRFDGRVHYVGFVEQVSPDNGKLQIRVSDAYVGQPGFRPGDFVASVIWDSPDVWDLCE